MFIWSPEKIVKNGTHEAFNYGVAKDSSENVNISILNRSICDVLDNFLSSKRYIADRKCADVFKETIKVITSDHNRMRVNGVEDGDEFHQVSAAVVADSFKEWDNNERTWIGTGTIFDQRTFEELKAIPPIDLEKLAFRFSAREHLANALLARNHFGSGTQNSIAFPTQSSPKLSRKNKEIADAIGPFVNRETVSNGLNREQFAMDLLGKICAEKDFVGHHGARIFELPQTTANGVKNLIRERDLILNESLKRERALGLIQKKTAG